jgi:hypothetical protein
LWNTLEREKQLQKSGHVLEDNIKMDLKEVGFKDVDWIRVDHNGCKKGAFAKTVVTIAFRKRR